VDISSISFRRTTGPIFCIECQLFCDFEHEGVARSLVVPVNTEIEFRGLFLSARVIEPTPKSLEAIRMKASEFVVMDGYLDAPRLEDGGTTLLPRVPRA
jgi:hypothetical protein